MKISDRHPSNSSTRWVQFSSTEGAWIDRHGNLACAGTGRASAPECGACTMNLAGAVLAGYFKEGTR